MREFAPVYFGDYHRFVAICKEGYFFVADAHVYDYANKDRATVVHFGKLEEINTIWEIVYMFGEKKWRYIEKPNLWMLDASKIDLMMLNKVYMGKVFAEVIA